MGERVARRIGYQEGASYGATAALPQAPRVPASFVDETIPLVNGGFRRDRKDASMRSIKFISETKKIQQ